MYCLLDLLLIAVNDGSELVFCNVTGWVWRRMLRKTVCFVLCWCEHAAPGDAAALNHMSHYQKRKSQKQKTGKPQYILESVPARTGSLTKVQDESV